MKGKKVIVVEDDKMLMTVFSMYLKELGHEMVGGFTEAKSAIEKCKEILPDIVLMDIHLPGDVDGINAAEIIQSEYDVPVIFISSYTDEQTISRAVGTHSYGYLVKPVDKIEMGITIELAYERHRFEKGKMLNRHIVDYLPEAIIGISLAGKITFWNEGANHLFNLSGDFTLGKEFGILFPGSDLMDIQEQFIESTLANETYETEIEFDKGTEFYKVLRFSFSLMRNDNGEVIGIICYAKRVAKLLSSGRTENDAEADFKAVFQGATEALFIISRENLLLDYNRLAKQYFTNILREEPKVGSDILSYFPFFPKEEFEHLFDNVLDGVSHYLERMVEIGNEVRYFRVTIYPVYSIDSHDINRFCMSLLDITENKRIERELEETRTEIKPLFDSSIQRFYLCDLNYKIITFNKAAKDIILKEFNRVIKRGDNVLDFVPGEVGEESFRKLFEDAKKGNNIVFKERLSMKGEYYWNETHVDPVMNERGEIYRVLIWTLDITEREQSLNELKQSQERYSLVARGGNDGLWDWDIPAHEVYLSPRWKSLLGYEDYELKNEFGVRDSLIHPDDLAESNQVLKDYLEGKIDVYQNEIRLRHKKGHYIWVIERGVILSDDEGKPIRLAGSITDITKQKKIESEIREAHSALLQERKMFIQGNVVIARVKADKTKQIGYISENVKEVLGYTPEDFQEGLVSYDAIVYPDDVERHKEEREKAIQCDATHIAYSPYRLIKKDGSFIWIKDFATFIRNGKNEVVEMLGYFVDISEQKQTEEALVDNQKKYFSLFAQANDAILIIDRDIIFDCNTKAEELFGYQREELLGKEVITLSPEWQPSGTPTHEKRKRKIEEAYQGKKGTFYWQYCKKDGTPFDSEVSLTVIDLQGKQYLHAGIRDITERKSIERSLRQSEEKYRALLEAIPDLIFIVDRKGSYKYYKPDIRHELELPLEKIIDKNISDFFEGEMLVQMRNCIDTAIKKREIRTLEYELMSSKGKRSFEARISAIDDETVLLLVRDRGNVIS